MEHKMITLFCLIDEFLKSIQYKDHTLAHISNSEVLFLGYLAVNDFNGNYTKAHSYAMALSLVNKIEYSRFIRRLNKLEDIVEQLFHYVSTIFMRLNDVQVYSVDSFPVEICKIEREKSVRLWQDSSMKGYNASKKRYFYGFKVHMCVTTDQEPVLFYITEGSMHDVTASYKFLPNLPQNSIVIGDKGYVSNPLETFLAGFGIQLSPLHRKNMPKDNEHGLKRKIRKGVETAFSVITSKFGKVIKATSIGGFLVKLKLFILAYSLDMLFKSLSFN